MTNKGTVITDDPATWPEVGRKVLVRETPTDGGWVQWIVGEAKRNIVGNMVLYSDWDAVELVPSRSRVMWWPLPEVTE